MMRLPLNYSDFLKKAKHHEIGALEELIHFKKDKKHNFQDSLYGFGKLAPASYILDYTTGRYIYASSQASKFVDHPLQSFVHGGVDFGISLFHKQDLGVYSNKIMTENIKFLSQIPVAQHSDYLFTCNYRVRNKKGEFKNIVQQSIFIKSAITGIPLATFGFLFDISNYRNDGRIYHSIESLNVHQSNSESETLISNIFFADEREKILTKREIEILKYVCAEMESSEIADKLHISKHTVDNHRRSLLMKTNSKNSIGLTKFAMLEGYLS